jgi:hypothetical protein
VLVEVLRSIGRVYMMVRHRIQSRGNGVVSGRSSAIYAPSSTAREAKSPAIEEQKACRES